MSKPGRNDPCPCGSGKKFKNCCMNKQQEPKKTYTLGGKRKFKAKVIDAASSSIFSTSGAATPTGSGNPDTLKALRFRMSGHDYRPEENEENKHIPQPTESAPKQQHKTEHKPGEKFEGASENFQVDEK